MPLRVGGGWVGKILNQIHKLPYVYVHIQKIQNLFALSLISTLHLGVTVNFSGKLMIQYWVQKNITDLI